MCMRACVCERMRSSMCACVCVERGRLIEDLCVTQEYTHDKLLIMYFLSEYLYLFI